MHNVVFDVFPGGRAKALTLSYDDGVQSDRRLVELLNAHGLRGTFHIHSAELDRPYHLGRDEIRELFDGHEVSAHTVSHPRLTTLPADWISRELLMNRLDLEQLVAYPVRGMSYPYGDTDERVIRMLPAAGIEYARTTGVEPDFRLPSDLLRWHPSGFDRDDRLLELGREFLEARAPKRALLMCVWGHSWQTEEADDWHRLEDFCRLMGGREDVWSATLIEIASYMTATRRMRGSADGRWLHNPSAIPVWASADGSPVVVQPGEILDLEADPQES